MAAKRQTAANNKFLEITKRYAKSAYSILVKYMNEASDDDYDGVFTPMATIVRCAVRNTHPERRHLLIAELKEQGYAVPMDVDNTLKATGSMHNVRVGDIVARNGVFAEVESIAYKGDIITLYVTDEDRNEHIWSDDKVTIFETAAAHKARVSPTDDETPNVQNRSADNGESSEVARESVKLTKAQANVLKGAGISGTVSTEYYSYKTLSILVNKGLMTWDGRATEAGREYARLQGWMPSEPAAAQTSADVVSADTFDIGEAVTFNDNGEILNGVVTQIVHNDVYDVRYTTERNTPFFARLNANQLTPAAQTQPANEAGTGDVKPTTLDALVALVVDQYDVNPLAMKANKALDAVGAELDAKDATIAKLQADNEKLREELDDSTFYLRIMSGTDPMPQDPDQWHLKAQIIANEDLLAAKDTPID